MTSHILIPRCDSDKQIDIRKINAGGVRPTITVHDGSKVVLCSFPYDRRSVNISVLVSVLRVFWETPGICANFKMGINTLLPFLKEATKDAFIGDYKGKTAAVDVSCWLHKALTVSVQRTGRQER